MAGVYTSSVAIKPNFEGLKYIKCCCSLASGFKEAHSVLPGSGVQLTSLVALVLSTGTLGSLEYYEPERFAVVISNDFMSRQEEIPCVNVMRY